MGYSVPGNRARARFTSGSYAHTSSDIEVAWCQTAANLRTRGYSPSKRILGCNGEGYPTHQRFPGEKQTHLVGAKPWTGCCDGLNRSSLEIRRFREGPGGSMRQDPRVRCCNRWRRSFGQRDRGRRRARARDEHTAKSLRTLIISFSSGDQRDLVRRRRAAQRAHDRGRRGEDTGRRASRRSRPVAADHV